MLLGRTFPEKMSESGQRTSGNWWKTPLLHRWGKLQQREDQVFLVLALVIGASTGLAVVAFILLTERMGMRLYPAGGARRPGARRRRERPLPQKFCLTQSNLVLQSDHGLRGDAPGDPPCPIRLVPPPI